jgi:hypothetical protein
MPYCREAGAGPAVACLHGNASVSGRWRARMARLGDRFHVLARAGTAGAASGLA